MNLGTLALVVGVALLGPALSVLSRWRLPVAIGELLAGILIGGSGLRWVDASEPAFSFLGSLGFAVMMFVAGTHVPLRDARLRPALGIGALRAVLVGVLAAALGTGLGALFGTGHGAVYAVVLASSSAALVLPAVQQLHLGGPDLLPTLAQVAIADTACIVALPLVIDPDRAGQAAIGSVAIAFLAVLLAFGLRLSDRFPGRTRLHEISVRHSLALELRLSLLILVAMAALASVNQVSVMLAGFAAGLAVSSAGEPHRLARQLFGVADGFLSPLFFVWLGASLSVSSLVKDPPLMLLGLSLGIGAILIHLVMAFLRQHPLWSIMAAAQLGVPAGAAAIGAQSGLLTAGEPAALILGALVTIAGLTIAGAVATHSKGFPSVPPPRTPG